jgi:voltage-gated potassium channel
VKLTGEGAAGYSFFVLRDGTATVSIDGVEVRTLGEGDFFGELALLGDGRRTATVTTASPSRVLVLFGTEFRHLQQEHPEIAARIESGLREIAQAA